MNKTAFKIFFVFSFIAVIVTVIMLILNAFGFAIIASDNHMHIFNQSPQGITANIDKSLVKTDTGFALSDDELLPDNCWCILLDENGDIIWSKNQPHDIPTHYTINDIARLTRWFLNDYPVYVRINQYGLIILGTPKNSVGKYEMAYSMEWFNTLPQRLLAILVINIVLSLLLVLLFGTNLYRGIQRLVTGINDLKNEKGVKLPEKGLFREVSSCINATSASIERKNLALLHRDSARSNWISCISHDIRTPLSMIMGYSESIADSGNLTAENADKIRSITRQSIKIKKLIEDLNLISSLEYDMQPSRKCNVPLCPLVRRVVSDIINNAPAGSFEIELNLKNEKDIISADEALIERAIFNLINNCIVHNSSGCKIDISQYSDKETIYLNIQDNGRGVSEEVINNISNIPKSAHGLGLPMAYKIIRAHGGSFSAENRNGFFVEIKIPRAKQ